MTTAIWPDVAAIAAVHHRHFRFGGVLLIIVVLAALGYGVFRFVEHRSARNRKSKGPHLDAEWKAGPANAERTGAPGEPSEPSGERSGDHAPPSPPPPPLPSPPPPAKVPVASTAPETSVASAVFSRDDLAVETHELTKRFGQNIAVDNVALRVPRGFAFGYLGPNGAGKTTLIRTLLGLTRADRGTMALLGLPVPAERSRALAKVAAIVDEPRFHGHLTGRDNLRILAAARGGEAEERIPPALDRVGLSERGDDKVSSYSMGMRQRLGVAACLIGDPELLILDEPMNGLDPAGMHQMRAMIRDLVREGRTVVLSSHLLDEVERTCDAVAIVDRGSVIRQGPIDELVRGTTVILQVECSDPPGAATLVRQAGFASAVEPSEAGLTVTLPAGTSRELVAEVNRRLVDAGFSVYALQEVRASLEDWFLSVTSRLGERQ